MFLEHLLCARPCRTLAHMILSRVGTAVLGGGLTEGTRRGAAYHKRTMSSSGNLDVRRSLFKDEDWNLVLQDTWVQLVRGKGENVPSGREERSRGGEGGMAMACSQDLRRQSSFLHVCLRGRDEGARLRTEDFSPGGVA